MTSPAVGKLSAFHIFEGLEEGLCHYSGQSKLAIIYAIRPEDPVFIYDPQYLLRGHEPKLKELYLDSNEWRDHSGKEALGGFGRLSPVENLQLAGLISFGGKSDSLFYQMWFTEHHPDMCSVGPTERWLEHAVWLLSKDLAAEDDYYTGTSGYVLREYATHAVRDFIVDELNIRVGMDIQIRVYPILDTVLGISKTTEEGSWPRGELVFVEPSVVKDVQFEASFPQGERPNIQNFKHVRKLLQAVEYSGRKLVSDGNTIVGIAGTKVPGNSIIADFRGRHGFLNLDNDPVCSFFDGNFHSSTRRAKMVQLEEILLESEIGPDSDIYELFKVIQEIVHDSQDKKHGCTLVIDLNETPISISGQHLEKSLNLRKAGCLELTKSLAKLDGALHIGRDIHLHGFACILDGKSIEGEDRSRGARFNSALRFTGEHQNIVVVVVSADRPVSIIQGGLALNAACRLNPVSSSTPSPPSLAEWIKG
jgi:hypothetical protein